MARASVTEFGVVSVRIVTGDEIANLPKSPSQEASDAEFMQWCKEEKPCKYCHCLFVGPCCLNCELNSILDDD